jgi:small subunit ribosomal protein S4
MARYTGPKVRLSRRLNTNLFENEKGRKALERRPFPPGQHGRTRRRSAGSEYLAQLQEKQKAKYIYGVLERQFRKTYEEANRLQGPTGENLLRLLELRLDNIVYRAGFGSTRPQARQFVSHGLILVNGKRLNIPSARVKKGDVITLAVKARDMIVIQHNIDTLDRSLVGWLESGDGGKQVTVRNEPAREHIDVPVREQLIVELYSKQSANRTVTVRVSLSDLLSPASVIPSVTRFVACCFPPSPVPPLRRFALMRHCTSSTPSLVSPRTSPTSSSTSKTSC